MKAVPRSLPLALVSGLTLLFASPVTAQEDPAELADLCAADGPDARTACLESALGLEAARAVIGLAAAGGADLPGTNSTVGKRIGSLPRWGLSLRAGFANAPLPGPGSATLTDGTTTAFSLRANLALGLLEGFSIAPTVGGIFSLDLMGEAALVTLSEDDGFGEDMTGFGVGVRLGILRESFGIPGVTVTATRRWLGESSLAASVASGDRSSDFDTRVTSLRGVVGKDFFAIGFLAGIGWDRYDGDGSLLVSGPDFERRVGADDLSSERVSIFGAVSYNFLVLQLSAEGGWAEGFDGGLTSDFAPDDSSFFGSVAFRLIL